MSSLVFPQKEGRGLFEMLKRKCSLVYLCILSLAASLPSQHCFLFLSASFPLSFLSFPVGGWGLLPLFIHVLCSVVLWMVDLCDCVGVRKHVYTAFTCSI